VEAYGSAQVRAYDSAQVEAYGSAQVRASGSAQVRASGSAQVRASGSAQVRASGSAQVRASKYVAVTRHGDSPKVTGGVLIQVPDLSDPEAFCDFYGVTVEDSHAVLFKALDGDLKSKHGAVYALGGEVSCDDWDPTPACGGGLHFSPRPWMAERYHVGASRFVACLVPLAEAVVTPGPYQPDKVKAPRCSPVYECDRDGERLAAEAASR
jgi:hypothetical protein